MTTKLQRLSEDHQGLAIIDIGPRTPGVDRK